VQKAQRKLFDGSAALTTSLQDLPILVQGGVAVVSCKKV
jgi:hypothetical protein